MANKICTGIGVVIDKDKLSMMMDSKAFTNARLATIIGVDKTTISNWKAGKCKVNKKNHLSRCSQYLNARKAICYQML